MSGPASPGQAVTVAALVFFWALNWPMMKIGLGTVEPWTFRGLSVLAGGIGSLALARLVGARILVARAELPSLLLLSFSQATLWNGLSGFGIAWSDAGRASILAFTMPLWATLMGWAFLGERPTRRRLAGLALGLLGMGALLVPTFDRIEGQLAGAVMMLLAAVGWAGGTVAFKAGAWTSHILTVSGWHFLIGGAPIVAAALVFGAPSTLLDATPATAAAIVFSMTVPMIFCQYVWFKIVQRLPAGLAATGTLAVPPLGLGLAALILGEPVGWAELVALLLVTGGLGLVLLTPRPALAAGPAAAMIEAASRPAGTDLAGSDAAGRDTSRGRGTPP